jgi:hypothetical protein
MIENQLANSRIIIPVGPGKIYDVDVQDLLQVLLLLLLLLPSTVRYCQCRCSSRRFGLPSAAESSFWSPLQRY